MEKYKKIVETTIIDENGKQTKTKKITEHTIKKWRELTREEKEKEIENYNASIYQSYQEDMYNQFKCDLDNLKYEFKNIQFEDVYMDSNSQGWWIDRIKNFKYSTDDITIYGEELLVDDVDFVIRKTIEDFDITIDDYYIEYEKLEKIKNTKKYKNWVENIKKDIKNWVDRVNEICSDLGNSEYYCPCDLDDKVDEYYLNCFFEDISFEEIKTIE